LIRFIRKFFRFFVITQKTTFHNYCRHFCFLQYIISIICFFTNGGLVAFPTETVYGLGADALKEEAAMKTYAAKGRPSDNPLIVHIAEYEDLRKIAVNIPAETDALAAHFWPGPLTMIFEKTPELSELSHSPPQEASHQHLLFRSLLQTFPQ